MAHYQEIRKRHLAELIQDQDRLVALLQYLRPGGKVIGSTYFASAPYNLSNRETFSCDLTSTEWRDDFVDKKGDNILTLIGYSMMMPGNGLEHYWPGIWLQEYMNHDRRNAHIELPKFRKNDYEEHMVYGFKDDWLTARHFYRYYDAQRYLVMFELGINLKGVSGRDPHFFAPMIFDPNAKFNNASFYTLPNNRPLYNWHQIVEPGMEKVAIAHNPMVANSLSGSAFMNNLFWYKPGHSCVTTCCGSPHLTNWEPINNMKVVIVPPAEGYIDRWNGGAQRPREQQDGWKWAVLIADILSQPGKNNNVMIVDPTNFVAAFNGSQTIHSALQSNVKKEEINAYVKDNLRVHVGRK